MSLKTEQLGRTRRQNFNYARNAGRCKLAARTLWRERSRKHSLTADKRKRAWRKKGVILLLGAGGNFASLGDGTETRSSKRRARAAYYLTYARAVNVTIARRLHACREDYSKAHSRQAIWELAGNYGVFERQRVCTFLRPLSSLPGPALHPFAITIVA